MAHTKAGGSTKLGRDSASKRLGIKVNHGEAARVGAVIVRQRGSYFVPGKNVLKGGDDTLYAKTAGTVNIRARQKKKFDGAMRAINIVTVLPERKS